MADNTTAQTAQSEGWFKEWGQTVFYAIAIALVIRSFLFQPYNIPSGSMVNTLLIGDYLFVSKYAYGYSKHSFPFSPGIFDGRIWGTEPERGDISVFKTPQDNSTDFIKRVIGLPGDEIRMRDGVLIINGIPVPREYVGDYTYVNSRGVARETEMWRETLPNGVSYITLNIYDHARGDNTPAFKVPAGHFFMMGDNRDDSNDSRIPGSIGYVPLENFVGRAELRWLSTHNDAPAWQVWNWNLSRFFQFVE